MPLQKQALDMRAALGLLVGLLLDQLHMLDMPLIMVHHGIVDARKVALLHLNTCLSYNRIHALLYLNFP